MKPQPKRIKIAAGFVPFAIVTVLFVLFSLASDGFEWCQDKILDWVES